VAEVEAKGIKQERDNSDSLYFTWSGWQGLGKLAAQGAWSLANVHELGYDTTCNLNSSDDMGFF